MEGKILFYNEETQEGVIRTQSGDRFSFHRGDIRANVSPRVNMKVDFIGEGKQARDILPFSPQQSFQELASKLPPVQVDSGIVKKMLDFEHMITPSLVKVLYLLLLGIIVLTGLYNIFWADYYFMGGRAMAIVIGIAWLIIGPIILRVICEGILVAFKILENLKRLRKELSNPS